MNGSSTAGAGGWRAYGRSQAYGERGSAWFPGFQAPFFGYRNDEGWATAFRPFSPGLALTGRQFLPWHMGSPDLKPGASEIGAGVKRLERS